MFDVLSGSWPGSSSPSVTSPAIIRIVSLRGLSLSQSCCILSGSRKHRRSIPVPNLDRGRDHFVAPKPGEGKVQRVPNPGQVAVGVGPLPMAGPVVDGFRVLWSGPLTFRSGPGPGQRGRQPYAPPSHGRRPQPRG